jgi:exopolysaccharide biosynthesis polyprenyl glycosylphosphotransferase
MPKPIEKLLLVITDFITINCAFILFTQIRSSLDLFVEQSFWFILLLSLMVYFTWLLAFVFSGMYQSWYTQSRFDELVATFKVVSFGILLIFIVTFEPEHDLSQLPTTGRFMILSYYAIMLFSVGGGRLALHTIQRKLLLAGIGLRNTLIIGWNDNAREMATRVKKFPALGYKILGFVSLGAKDMGEEFEGLPVLGNLRKLEKIVEKNNIEEVILALGKKKNKEVLSVVAICEDLPVHIKIEPDLYNIVTGHARTHQIYGFPLIEIQPQLMLPWERRVKRLIDISFSLGSLIILSPLLILTSLLVKLESRGPVLFKQKRVGKNGKIFQVYKFRSMVQDAEKLTGPVWAGKKDPRITRMGRVTRKLRIDEFPQLFNVLYGDMSLVGPRPERPYFVDKLKRQYPFYTRRLKVQPGVTGWAQVKGKYDTTIEEVKEKLDYDLYYIENISLRLDFRIMIYTISVMLRFKGQ